MMTTAFPKYVPLAHVQEAPPGHRFRLYFEGSQNDWGTTSEAKTKALQNASKWPGKHTAPRELRLRQLALAVQLEGSAWTTTMKGTSPLVTGTGIEHPLDNGFAFMDPHGVPCLPGSSVKGTLRRAAEELALFASDSLGWTIGHVWRLFGFEGTSAYLCSVDKDRPEPVRQEHQRWRDAYAQHIESVDMQSFDWLRNATEALEKDAAPGDKEARRAWLRDLNRAENARKRRDKLHTEGTLRVWDTFAVGDGPLRVDVMTPHQKEYYEKGDHPSDDQGPVPIQFLAVPPEWHWTFVVQAADSTLGVPRDWKQLVQAAFTYAVEWLGFGAKTSVGYGRMKSDPAMHQAILAELQVAQRVKQERAARERAAAEQAARVAAYRKMGPTGELLLSFEQSANREGTAADIIKNHLDALDGDGMCLVATRLKQFYQEIGKWSGKQSPKQAEKVTKLRRILGES